MPGIIPDNITDLFFKFFSAVAPDIISDTSPDITNNLPFQIHIYIISKFFLDGVFNIIKDINLDIIQDIIIDITLDIITDIKPDIIPDISPDIIPDINPDITIDLFF